MSENQLTRELKELYESVTNPEKREQKKIDERRKKDLEDKKKDYGLYE